MEGANNQLRLLSFYDGATFLGSFGCQASGSGNFPIAIWYVYFIGGVNASSPTNFSLGALHYAEMRWKSGDSGAAIQQVWVDGDLIFDETGTDTGGCNKIIVGHDTANIPKANCVIDFDDIKADASPVGAYSDAGGGIVVLRRRRM